VAIDGVEYNTYRLPISADRVQAVNRSIANSMKKSPCWEVQLRFRPNKKVLTESAGSEMSRVLDSTGLQIPKIDEQNE
jgi:hypothetical protein